ncbi:MAG: hypothetical protein QOH92_2872 [Chloroflexota bacterium]|jgi:hypothetical protein|nr:hypothetical protein [Chloroflexota bacterium]
MAESIGGRGISVPLVRERIDGADPSEPRLAAKPRGRTLINVRIESPAFTERDMRAFLVEAVDYERRRLADRLEAASARLGQLAPTLTLSRRESEDSEGWSAQELLAHIAVLSKFYGVLTSRVGWARFPRSSCSKRSRVATQLVNS